MKFDHKKHIFEILVGITCASVGALIGQYFAMGNLAKSLKTQQNAEVLNSTRLGIGFLMQAQNELDENFALLLNNDYDISLEFGPPHSMYDSMHEMFEQDPKTATNSVERAQAEQFLQLFRTPTRHIDRMDIPEQELSNEVWKHGPPEMADINYDLLRKLSDYYMLVQRVNSMIEAFNRTQIQPGAETSPEMVNHLQQMAAAYEEDLKRLKAKDEVELKGDISSEIQRLSSIRGKIEAQ